MSFAPVASPQQSLQGFNVYNQNNHGIIGDSSNNIVASGDNSQVHVTQITTTGTDVELDSMLDRYISKDALHNSFYSPPKCHPNTRTTVLNEIGGWIDESESEKSPLLWLNGPAAVGKSVIAKTISSFHDQIVATFFFSTSSDKTAVTLFPTLAWQLAQRIPDTKKHIIASLKKGGSLLTSQIEEQFDQLIIQPLRSTTGFGFRPVIVIDGVDECSDEQMLIRFLRVLVQTSENGDMPVRFIVCSRPEPRIRIIMDRTNDNTSAEDMQRPALPGPLDLILNSLLIFLMLVGSSIPASLGLSSKYCSPIWVFLFLLAILHRKSLELEWWRGLLDDLLHLYRPMRFGANEGTAFSEAYNDSFQDVYALDKVCHHPVISSMQLGFSKECKEDIAKYLTDKFNEFRHTREGASIWPQPSEISDLVEASCGQFLYATTIVRLLDESGLDPKDVLNMARSSSLPTRDLNELYKAILKRAQDTIRNRAKEGGPDYETEWKYVSDSLAILVFFAGNAHLFTVQKSFPVTETLLGLENGKLTSKLNDMHSVLNIVSGESIQVHHRSFLEFLQSQRRSGAYYSDYSTASRWILTSITRATIRHVIMLPFK